MTFEEWKELHRFQGSSCHTKHLAKYLGVTTRTIQRWMNGTGKPKDIHLKRLANYDPLS